MVSSGKFFRHIDNTNLFGACLVGLQWFTWFPLLAIENGLSPAVALEAGWVTSRNRLQITISSLNYHVYLVNSVDVRLTRFQNIGILGRYMSKLLHATNSGHNFLKEKTKSWKIFSPFSVPALYPIHMHVAVNHMNLLIAYDAVLYDPAWLLKLHIIVRFRFFLGFLMEMAKACRCAEIYTACCSIEYRIECLPEHDPTRVVGFCDYGD